MRKSYHRQAEQHLQRRNRAVYVLAVAVVIVLGLASRRYTNAVSEVFGKYPGDALWAAMVFFCWGALRPQASIATVAFCAFATCVVVEALKLYQAPWIVSLRHTTLGHLILGEVFSVPNLLAYPVGVILAAAVEVAWLRRGKTYPPGSGT